MSLARARATATATRARGRCRARARARGLERARAARDAMTRRGGELGRRRAVGDDDDGRYEATSGAGAGAGTRAGERDGFREARRRGREAYARAPGRTGGTAPPGTRWSDDGDAEDGGRRGGELNKFLVAGAFVVGIGAGVVFDTAVDLEPSNVASREILDRRTPSSELCMANGASAMVFDQRVFLSLNPFNVYVAQPEVKPGCVLRRSNWNVLERKGVVDKKSEDVCKSHMNTFAFVGNLDQSPEVSCVYHSEEAENQFMRDPSRAVLGDGVVQTMREKIDAQTTKGDRFR